MPVLKGWLSFRASLNSAVGFCGFVQYLAVGREQLFPQKGCPLTLNFSSAKIFSFLVEKRWVLLSLHNWFSPLLRRICESREEFLFFKHSRFRQRNVKCVRRSLGPEKKRLFVGVPDEGLKVLGCTCALGSVMLCVHSWKIWIEKIKMPSLPVYALLPNSVGTPQLVLSSGSVRGVRSSGTELAHQ